MSNAITIYNQFDQLTKAASALVKSGYFQDVKTEAQAIVKVMAGAELGLPPFSSMTGIHIIQGKPVLGSNLIATLVKNDPRYDYHIKTSTNTECVIEWLEGGKVVGTSEFTMNEAKAANLTGKDNWNKYPSDMLFARALTRGARRYAPGIFGGSPIYTPEELGAETDEEGNIIIDSVAKDVTPPPAQPVTPPANGKLTLETAMQEKNREGVAYGDLPTDTLAHMANSLDKLLAKNGMTPEERAEKEYKRDACRVILDARSKSKASIPLGVIPENE